MSDGLDQVGHTCISCLSRVCHQCVFVQGACLVIGGLEDGGSTHRSLGRRDQREVLARYAQEYLGPGYGMSAQESITRPIDTHIFAVAVLWSVGMKELVVFSKRNVQKGAGSG